MQLTFLGTSSGAPTKDRNVTAVALRNEGTWDLFDCGEGTQHRLLATPLSLPKLRRIFISHLHGDHCFGLFGLLGSRSMAGATTPLDIFGPPGLQEMVTMVLETSDSFMTYPINWHSVPQQGGRVVETPSQVIDAIELDHRVMSLAWHITEADRPGAFDAERAQALGVEPGPAFGQLQRGNDVVLANGGVVRPADVMGAPRQGRTLIIAGDNRDPERLLQASGQVQVLVHESTYTEEVVAHLGQDQGHSTAARVAKAAAAAHVPNLILTHFSPRFAAEGHGGQTVAELREEATAHYDGKVHLAEDYAVYEIALDGSLKAS